MNGTKAAWVVLLMCSCGGPSALGNRAPGSAAADADALKRVDGGTRDAGMTDMPKDAGFDVALALGAAAQAAATDPTCTSIGDFVWEIGDVNGRRGGGQIGTTYTTATPMELASATKWLFGAYVVERFKDRLGDLDVGAMTMRSGYVSFSYGSCTLFNTPTVAKCFAALSNDKHTPENDGLFFYNGGHFQKYAVDLGLGALTNATLAQEFMNTLGHDVPVTFDTPQLAAGAVMSLDGYAVFLRKIMRGDLAIHAHLGENATCTLPGLNCPTAVSSPAPYALHYSYGHWVEDEPATGDGSFSSAGAFGFYPWVDSRQQFYGIVARHVSGPNSYVESAKCGRAIRFAFFKAAK